MKLNNKGMTIVELLVSVVLISLVLTFVLQLLSDLKNETYNNDYAYYNQVNRTEAIYTIEKDLMSYTLTGIEDVSASNLKLNFYYIKESSTTKAVMWVENNSGTYYLKYNSYDGTSYSWKMQGATINPCGLFTYYTNNSTENYYFKLNIYLYNSTYNERNNEEYNNAVDDIEITYSGDKGKLTSSSAYLTGSSSKTVNIGICS